MKVLVVDDELYCRKALVKIITLWNNKTQYIDSIEDVENGIEAIDFIQKNELDMLITDVRMPEIDGLKLSEYVKNNYPNITVIIISGYSEFEYAQKAIEFEVKNYLLKPVNPDKLYECLDNIMLNKNLEYDTKQQFSNTKQELTLLNHTQKLISAIYNQNNTYKTFNSLLSIPKEPTYFFTSVIQSTENLNPINIKKIEDFIEDNFKNRVIGFYNLVKQNEYICFHLFFNDNNSENHNSLNTKDMLKIRNMLQNINIEIYCGVSDFHKTTASISTSYNEAKYSLNNRLLFPSNLFIYSKEITNPNSYFNENEKNIIVQKLSTSKISSLEKFIYTIFMNIKNGENSISIIQDTYFQIMMTIYKSVYNSHEETYKTSLNYNSIMKNLNEFFSIEALVKQIISYANSFLEMNLNDSIPHDDFVEELSKYIIENNFYSISLETIAKERYYMNPNYFSRMFKKKTGQTFSQFLLNKRMEKAQQLLEYKELTISEIARLVGYNSSSHFIQSYKKVFGITPGYINKED